MKSKPEPRVWDSVLRNPGSPAIFYILSYFDFISNIFFSYHPLPVVFESAKGAKSVIFHLSNLLNLQLSYVLLCRVWDPEGKEYIDMLSAYSYVHMLFV